MGTRKRYQTLLFSTLPAHARHLILHKQLQEFIRVMKRKTKANAEKPNIHLTHYKNYRMLIRLRHWCITNQATSMMEAQYSREPRDPE